MKSTTWEARTHGVQGRGKNRENTHIFKKKPHQKREKTQAEKKTNGKKKKIKLKE